MLSFTNSPFMLSVVTLNVIMLNVVAPLFVTLNWFQIDPTLLRSFKSSTSQSCSGGQSRLPDWEQLQVEDLENVDPELRMTTATRSKSSRHGKGLEELPATENHIGGGLVDSQIRLG
jgi:hypothetical protein